MKQLKQIWTSLLFALIISIPSFALAEDKEEIEMLSQTKINLTQAIAVAEKHIGGVALSASIDDDSFTPAYEVSITKEGKVFDVQVDGVKGEVIGSREDHDD